MQSMRLWKMSVDQWKGNFCNSCEYYFVDWWVKADISSSSFLFFSLAFCVFKINFMTKTKRETLDETPNLKWSVVRCTPTYSNISKKYQKKYQKSICYYLSKRTQILNKLLEFFCKCHHKNK